MMKEVYIINTCDAWKSYSSFNLVGVYSSLTQVRKIVNQLLSEEVIEWEGNKFIDESSLEEIQAGAMYLHIEEVTLNERR